MGVVVAVFATMNYLDLFYAVFPRYRGRIPRLAVRQMRVVSLSLLSDIIDTFMAHPSHSHVLTVFLFCRCSKVSSFVRVITCGAARHNHRWKKIPIPGDWGHFSFMTWLGNLNDKLDGRWNIDILRNGSGIQFLVELSDHWCSHEWRTQTLTSCGMDIPQSVLTDVSLHLWIFYSCCCSYNNFVGCQERILTMWWSSLFADVLKHLFDRQFWDSIDDSRFVSSICGLAEERREAVSTYWRCVVGFFLWTPAIYNEKPASWLFRRKSNAE